MKNVMLDLETLATSTDAAIVQIGACYFDDVTGAIGDTFKKNIDLAFSDKEARGVLDPATVAWWLKQSDAARNSILTRGEPSVNVLHEVNEFLKPAKFIWSHATFDFVILSESMRRHNITPSFCYRTCMDIRTLTRLASFAKSVAWIREGTHHDALDDCKYQVKYCVDALNKLKGLK